MTIQEHKENFLNLEKEFGEEFVYPLLKKTLERIEFLESIYIVGRRNYGFLEKFREQAYAEREELSDRASACNSILDDRKEEIKK